MTMDKTGKSGSNVSIPNTAGFKTDSDCVPAGTEEQILSGQVVNVHDRSASWAIPE